MRRPPLNELQTSLEIIFGQLAEYPTCEFEDSLEFNNEIDAQLEKLGAIPNSVSGTENLIDFRELQSLTSSFFVGNSTGDTVTKPTPDHLLFLNDYWDTSASEFPDEQKRLSVANSLKQARKLMLRELEVANLNFFLISDILPSKVAELLISAGQFEFELLLELQQERWDRLWANHTNTDLHELKKRINQELVERNDYQSPIRVWHDFWHLITEERYCLRRGLVVKGSFNIRRVAFNIIHDRLKPTDKISTLSKGQWYSVEGLLKD